MKAEVYKEPKIDNFSKLRKMSSFVIDESFKNYFQRKKLSDAAGYFILELLLNGLIEIS